MSAQGPETPHARVKIKQLPTGVQGLDEILGGGLPEYSFNIIAGAPGSLYRMIGALTRLGVTIISTVEVEENFTSMGLSNFTISFLADDILRLRYASINGQLRKLMMVVKMRRSQHSIDMCAYEVTSKGLAIGEPMRGYRALTSGIPGPWSLQSGVDDPNG